MHLKYKGVFKDEAQLPRGELPVNAVKFKEPETPAVLNLVASVFIIPAWLVAGLVIAAAFILKENTQFHFASGFTSLGLLLAFVAILPHELLHGICFGRNAEVELYVSPKSMMVFVVSTTPVTKWRFIGISLCPSLVLGWLPLLLWALLPYCGGWCDALLSFAVLSITFGCGDYLNVFNALCQMPKGSLQQLHGFHSYWYMP